MGNGGKQGTFLKAQFTSLTASGADYLAYALLYYGLGIWYLTASVSGLITGGLISFMMGRNWVFEKGRRSMKVQAVLYILVWYGSAVLNTAGVYGLTEVFHVDPTISKVLVSITIGITYNYLLQKNLVFK